MPTTLLDPFLPAPDWPDLIDQAGLQVVFVDRAGRLVPRSGASGEAGGAIAGRPPATCAEDLGLPGPDHALWQDAWDPARPLPPPVEAPDGGDVSARWMRWRLARVADSRGGVAALALLGLDVTEARDARRRLQRTRDFYRALCDMGQAMLRLDQPPALYDAICRIAVESGGAAMAWIGLCREQRLVPCAWAGGAERYTEGLALRTDDPDLPESPQGPSAWAVRQGRAYVANDFRHDARTRRWLARGEAFGVRSCAAFPFRRQGVVIGSLNLYFTEPAAFDDALVELLLQLVSDLSYALEHIDRAAARQQAERAARDREGQLAGIVDCALDAIVALDRRQHVVLFNDAAARMFGVPREEALGRPLDRFLPPELREAHRGWLSASLRDGPMARLMGGSRRLEGLRADGERFPMEASISRTGEGDRVLLTMMARDVTLLRQAEQAQLSHAAAEAANRAKTDFLSRISHELRTPLNAVLGFTRLMAADADAPLPAPQRERLDRVLLAGEHLRTLMEEVLDVASIEAGRLVMDCRAFELRELVAGVVSLCEPAAQERGVHLALRGGAGPALRMRGDPGRLRQVLLNLVTNAIKYNRRDGHVEVSAEPAGAGSPHAVRLVVRDDGVGMSEAQRAQLFQPFNRLGRERSEVPGMGIGLVLVRQLVGLMGGELLIESEAGAGTTVRVSLPASPPAGAERAGDEAASPATSDGGAHPGDPAPAASSSPQGVVLYIEDNPVNAMLVEQLLARWPGVRLVVCPDGTTGLAQARALRPAVVLLDLQLPDLDGVEVLRRLKADAATRDVPVVAVSADALPEGIREARAAGAVDYWTKPLDFDAFLAGLRRLLAGGA